MKRKPPDTRLDWRDPDMPVLGKFGRPIDHRKMQTKSELAMGLPESRFPTYKNDPTYDLRRKK